MQDNLPLQDTQGERVVTYGTIVGMPGTDIRRSDRFVLKGTEYVVTAVHNHLSYEVKADVETYSGGRR
jgi:hypothetical protein